ncbi:uncharacterized protein LOC142830836 [Pelodiscus sinensis]|uniref:uncharacterized protein LOC142830836 n=1 Tax=Pelodiscus sinensis TaxID=13735 RepID=UPI003F6B3217
MPGPERIRKAIRNEQLSWGSWGAHQGLSWLLPYLLLARTGELGWPGCAAALAGSPGREEGKARAGAAELSLDSPVCTLHKHGTSVWGTELSGWESDSAHEPAVPRGAEIREGPAGGPRRCRDPGGAHRRPLGVQRSGRGPQAAPGGVEIREGPAGGPRGCRDPGGARRRPPGVQRSGRGPQAAPGGAEIREGPSGGPRGCRDPGGALRRPPGVQRSGRGPQAAPGGAEIREGPAGGPRRCRDPRGARRRPPGVQRSGRGPQAAPGGAEIREGPAGGPRGCRDVGCLGLRSNWRGRGTAAEQGRGSRRRRRQSEGERCPSPGSQPPRGRREPGSERRAS